MSAEITPVRKPRSQELATSEAPPIDHSLWTLRLVDAGLVTLFLALVFLLGVFPMKDTDFWWHLRTGDWIRAEKQVPTHDLYTFTVPDHPWIDLHWLFQLAISWGYEHGGVIALNIAKCIITCVSVFLLIAAKRREWPVWVMLLAWIPALLVLSGRMYIRPETLTLFYLSAFLAILNCWERIPWLALLLPVIQLVWVNTQGLFVLGPIVLVFALIEAVLRRHPFAESRKRWWKIIGLSTALTGFACFLNPYGIRGALYPLELAGTMGNPIFSQTIAELTPIPLFIKRNAGWSNLPLQLHIVTMFLGALSFLIPIVWKVASRSPVEPPPQEAASASAKTKGGKSKGESKPKRSKSKRSKNAKEEVQAPVWRLSVFRLFLFAAFSALSWQATRNSHQFAAVVGAVTAWNFGEWAAAVHARRKLVAPESRPMVTVPRVAMLLTLVFLLVFVASGKFYAMTGEGRVIGLGEEPLWFPHEAVKFCGKLGMPERFLSFHDGYSALYDYHNGPERKVFADARLEVIGPELFERYIHLKGKIATNAASWPHELDELGRPAVLVGHLDNSAIGATFLASEHWRCVWFDAIAAVFVHDSFTGAVNTHTVDFAARHFHPDPKTEPTGVPALTAAGKALWQYSNALRVASRSDVSRPMTLLGLDYARRVRRALPNALDGWKLLGQLEAARDTPGDTTIPRYRMPIDPFFDLSTLRATYAFSRAREASHSDFLTLLMLFHAYGKRGMDEAVLPILEEILSLRPINQEQLRTQEGLQQELEQLNRRLGALPSMEWSNLSELDAIVTQLLAAGRAGSAADLLERAYPEATRPWEVSDRIATLRIHLGEPERARRAWQNGLAPKEPALRASRVALSYLVEDELDEARRQFQEAIRLDPNLFEARYGLAVLEQDAGRAAAAYAEAVEAARLAKIDVARSAAQLIAKETKPYIQPE